MTKYRAFIKSCDEFLATNNEEVYSDDDIIEEARNCELEFTISEKATFETEQEAAKWLEKQANVIRKKSGNSHKSLFDVEMAVVETVEIDEDGDEEYIGEQYAAKWEVNR